MAIKRLITAAVLATLVCVFPLIAQGEDSVKILCLDQASCDAGSDDSPPATPDETENQGEEVVSEEYADEASPPQPAPYPTPTPAPTPAPVAPAPPVAPQPPPEPPDVCANYTGMKNLPEGWTRSAEGHCSPPPPRAGYCDPKTGKFYDLVSGHHKLEPYASMGLIEAYTDPVGGSISCDFPESHEKAPSASSHATEPAGDSAGAPPVKQVEPKVMAIPPPPAVKPTPVSETRSILPPPAVP